MYKLKKLERYLRVNLLGPGPRLLKKIIYRAAVSKRLRNTGVDCNLLPSGVSGKVIATRRWGPPCFVACRMAWGKLQLDSDKEIGFMWG